MNVNLIGLLLKKGLMRGLGHVMDKFETCVCFLGKYEILVSNYIQRNQLLHSNISEIIFLYFFFSLGLFSCLYFNYSCKKEAAAAET